MAPVAHHDLLELLHPRAVEEHAARGHAGLARGGGRGEGEDVAVLEHEHVLGGQAALHGQAGVLREHAVLAVDGDEAAGPHALDQLHELVLGGVARHVDAGGATVHDVAAAPEQVADQARDGPLVAGDGARGEDHGVARADGDLAVLVHADHGEGGEGLALAPGDEEAEAARGVVAQAHGREHARRGHLEQAQLHRHLGVLRHAPSHEGDRAPGGQGHAGRALDARDGGGEAGDEDPPARAREHVLEGGQHLVLARGAAAHLDVGAVREKGEHPALAPGAERFEVGVLVGGGGGPDLEVAAHDHHARGRLDGEGQAVDHAVRHPDGMDAEGSDLHLLPRREQAEVRLQPALAETAAHEPEGEGAAVHGRGRGLQGEGESADVVLVPVREDDAAHGLAPLGEIAEVGHHGVDARQLRGGEERAGVDEQPVVLPLEDERVEPELAEPAQGHEPDRSAV